MKQRFWLTFKIIFNRILQSFPCWIGQCTSLFIRNFCPSIKALSGAVPRGVWHPPPQTENHEFARQIWEFGCLLGKHGTPVTLCVLLAYIEATAAREGYYICLGCKKYVNFRCLWAVSRADNFWKCSNVLLFLFKTHFFSRSNLCVFHIRAVQIGGWGHTSHLDQWQKTLSYYVKGIFWRSRAS